MASNRTERLEVRLTTSGIEFLDQQRGAWSRSEYIRYLMKVAKAQNLKGPVTPEDM